MDLLLRVVVLVLATIGAAIVVGVVVCAVLFRYWPRE